MRPDTALSLTMELYRFECPSADMAALAQVVSDLFPEQTVFLERAGENGTPYLDVQWVAMRFGSSARRMTLTIKIAAPAWARYRAMPLRARCITSRLSAKRTSTSRGRCAISRLFCKRRTRPYKCRAFNPFAASPSSKSRHDSHAIRHEKRYEKVTRKINRIQHPIRSSRPDIGRQPT